MNISKHPYYKLNYYFEDGILYKEIESIDELIEDYKNRIEKSKNENEAIHQTLLVFATSQNRDLVVEARKSMKDIVTKKFGTKLTAAAKQIIFETIDMLIVCTVFTDHENDTWNYEQWCFQSELEYTQEELF